MSSLNLFLSCLILRKFYKIHSNCTSISNNNTLISHGDNGNITHNEILDESLLYLYRDKFMQRLISLMSIKVNTYKYFKTLFNDESSVGKHAFLVFTEIYRSTGSLR